MVITGLQLDCGCCTPAKKILIDGSSRNAGGDTLTQIWGNVLVTIYGYVDPDITVEFYADVSGPGFNLDDYGLIFLILPEADPDWVGDVATWSPALGPKRIVICGDANGDSPSPYDYGTAVADEIASLSSTWGFGPVIGADSRYVGDWGYNTVDLTAGMSLPLYQEESSEVDISAGGAITMHDMVALTCMGDETVSGVSFVVAGTPSFINDKHGSTSYDNELFFSNLWTVPAA